MMAARKGGAAPTSKRDTLFAKITRAENDRLRALVVGVRTVEHVVARFGPPDHDIPDGFSTTSRESETEPSRTVICRVLYYEKLSETADVHFTDFGAEGGVRVSFQGKYIGG